MIHVTCQCGRKLEAPDERAGHRGRCPFCGTVTRMPGDRVNSYVNSGALVIESAPLPTPPGSKSECPHCMAPIDPPPKRSRKCPHCREPIVLRRGHLVTAAGAKQFDEEMARRKKIWEAECASILADTDRRRKEAIAAAGPDGRYCIELPAYYAFDPAFRTKPGEPSGSIEVDGHQYTLQGGSAEQIRRTIANGTFTGFRNPDELKGLGSIVPRTKVAFGGRPGPGTGE